MASIKIGSTWNTIKLPYTRVSGTWRPCKQIYANVNGVWKIAFDLTAADTFDGTGNLTQTPGYVLWEQLLGTWSQSSGNVAGSVAPAVAAIETGVSNGEWEIDTAVTTTGGPGVGFWISDQSNWWGVRYYTEQYSYTIPGNAFYYNYNVYQVYSTRPAGNTNPSSFASCYYQYQSFGSTATNNYQTKQTGSRNCYCNTTANSSCLVNSSNFTFACVTSCSPVSYPSSCTRSTMGAYSSVNCGVAPTPCVTCVCGSCPSYTANTNYTSPCPSTPISFVTTNATPSTGCACNCTVLGSSTSNNNAISYNCPPYSAAPYSAVYSNYESYACPTGSSSPPCSSNTNNSAGYANTYSCTYIPYGVSFAGTNPATPATAIYKRGQLVQSSTGVVNIISNQDFGDVGNLYAKTYGNSVDFIQYSGAGKTGTAGATVTYAAPAGTKGTKHGIIITAVPYTQTYNIGRFKATI